MRAVPERLPQRLLWLLWLLWMHGAFRTLGRMENRVVNQDNWGEERSRCVWS
jgi:hypothetical protein